MNNFAELFEYTRYCNSDMLKLMNENARSLSEYAVKLINHVINAHQIWNARIEEQSPSVGVWDIRELSDLSHINEINCKTSIVISQKTEGDKPITYTNSKGEVYTSQVRDILFHVVNHSTYHRAQVAADLKKAGISPPVGDFIFYKRQAKG